MSFSPLQIVVEADFDSSLASIVEFGAFVVSTVFTSDPRNALVFARRIRWRSSRAVGEHLEPMAADGFGSEEPQGPAGGVQSIAQKPQLHGLMIGPSALVHAQSGSSRHVVLSEGLFPPCPCGAASRTSRARRWRAARAWRKRLG